MVAGLAQAVRLVRPWPYVTVHAKSDLSAEASKTASGTSLLNYLLTSKSCKTIALINEKQNPWHYSTQLAAVVLALKHCYHAQGPDGPGCNCVSTLAYCLLIWLQFCSSEIITKYYVILSLQVAVVVYLNCIHLQSYIHSYLRL